MRSILIVAALALLTTTAHADDAENARLDWVHTLIFYHKGCEPLGPDFQEAATRALGVPQDISRASAQRIADYYVSVGARRFCELTRERIAANRKWLFEVEPRNNR